METQKTQLNQLNQLYQINTDPNPRYKYYLYTEIPFLHINTYTN